MQPQQPTVRTTVKLSLAVLLVVVAAWLVYRAQGAVGAILAAALVATALLHAVDALERRRVRRGLAKALAITGFLAALAGLGLALVPRAASQTAALVQRAPQLLQRVQNSQLVRHLESTFHLSENLQKPGGAASLQQVGPPALAAVSSAIGLVVWLAMVLFLAVFMVLFGEELVGATLQLARPERRERYERVLRSVYHSVGGYLAGLTLICTINATLTTIFFAVTGTPYFLALGILSGFSSLVPYAGPLVVHSALTLFVLTTAGPWHALATLSYFVVYDSLEGNVLGPLVFRRTVHVNPLVSLASVLVLGEFAGIVGALVAVPVAAAGQILLREYFGAHRGTAPPTPA